MLYKLSVNRKHVVVAGDWNLTLVKKWKLPVIQILLFLSSFSFFLFSCKFHLFFFFSNHPLMFKFIIRHLSDCARPIAALFKKQQQKETWEGLVSPLLLPPFPPRNPPWQDSWWSLCSVVWSPDGLCVEFWNERKLFWNRKDAKHR